MAGPVEGPGEVRERVGEEREVGCGEVVEGGGDDDVEEEVGEGARDGAFEAVRWDCFLEVSESEGWCLAGDAFEGVGFGGAGGRRDLHSSTCAHVCFCREKQKTKKVNVMETFYH